MSLDYFLPLGVPFAKIVTCISFNKTSAKRGSMFSETSITRGLDLIAMFSNLPYGNFIENASMRAVTRASEHSSNFASNSSNGQIL